MPASFPASMLNQNPSDLGILNRFSLDPSRSSDEFTADFGGALEHISIGDCRLIGPLAEN
jgi:hypothetical protein